MSQNGKGDKRRPKSVNYKTWEKNYERIFRKKKMTKLRKNRHNKVLFGVCSGLADWLNVDTALVRLAFVVGAFLTGSLLLWIYLLLAIILPPE